MSRGWRPRNLDAHPKNPMFQFGLTETQIKAMQEWLSRMIEHRISATRKKAEVEHEAEIEILQAEIKYLKQLVLDACAGKIKVIPTVELKANLDIPPELAEGYNDWRKRMLPKK